MTALILFEDEHLLVVNKPAGWNTHAPAPYTGEGLYDWLRHREPRWASLAIMHRLDKETSGVLLFAKTALANRALTEQFVARAVRKEYLLLTDRHPPKAELTVTSALVRVGARYLSRPGPAATPEAVTRFTVLGARGPHTLVRAEPLTGRTHQIRVHAADQGFPVLGDALYGGAPAARLCLHAARLTIRHPASGQPVRFEAPPDFDLAPNVGLRAGLIDPEQTTAYRLIHGASDGWPGWYVDRLGDFLLSQAEGPLTEAQRRHLVALLEAGASERDRPTGAYHKRLSRHVRQLAADEAAPQYALGALAPESFPVRENGLLFELRFTEGYSVGLFLDQRDNRRRFLVNHVAAAFPLFPDGPAGKELLNVFAYTCGFSVCAARAGMRTTSLDLSKKYLEWGRQNFRLNHLDPTGHDFIFGDAFEWLRRLAKKSRVFDAVVLDPPTFSQSKEHGPFRAEADYGVLVRAALPLVRSGGVFFASTNAGRLRPERFVEVVESAVRSAGRSILQRHYVPQPPDFPVSRAEPAHLKTLWLRVG